MGKPTICICENKDADQLRGNREADLRLCFRYSDSTIPLLLKYEHFKLLALFCACTDRFVSDLFGNHIVGFPTRRLIYCEYYLPSKICHFKLKLRDGKNCAYLIHTCQTAYKPDVFLMAGR